MVDLDGNKNANTMEDEGYLYECALRYNGRRDPRGLFDLVFLRSVNGS